MTRGRQRDEEEDEDRGQVNPNVDGEGLKNVGLAKTQICAKVTQNTGRV